MQSALGHFMHPWSGRKQPYFAGMECTLLLAAAHAGATAGGQIAAAAARTARQEDIAAAIQHDDEDETAWLAQRKLSALIATAGIGIDGAEIGAKEEDGVAAATDSGAQNQRGSGTRPAG